MNAQKAKRTGEAEFVNLFHNKKFPTPVSLPHALMDLTHVHHILAAK